MKTSSKKEEEWRQPQKNEKNEDDLKKNKKWRQPQKKKKLKKTSKKIFSWFLFNLGANFSWGWLGSLRFLIYLLIL